MLQTRCLGQPCDIEANEIDRTMGQRMPTVSLSLCLHWCKLQTRARSAAAARKTFCHSSATGREQLHIWHTEDYIRIWTTRETWPSRSAVQALFLALELTVPWDPIASRRSVPPLRPGDMHFICSSCSEIHICKDCLGKLWSPSHLSLSLLEVVVQSELAILWCSNFFTHKKHLAWVLFVVIRNCCWEWMETDNIFYTALMPIQPILWTPCKGLRTFGLTDMTWLSSSSLKPGSGIKAALDQDV